MRAILTMYAKSLSLRRKPYIFTSLLRGNKNVSSALETSSLNTILFGIEACVLIAGVYGVEVGIINLEFLY